MGSAARFYWAAFLFGGGIIRAEPIASIARRVARPP